jgi:uncharacterized damage-inducible protein DinB
MPLSNARPGRPRRYDMRPPEGFANAETAYAVAALDELSERVLDLIVDLPQDALNFVPEGATNSIAMLVTHMAWAEANWVSRIASVQLANDLERSLQPGRQGPSGELPSLSASASQLTVLCQRVRNEVTRPALALVHDVNAAIHDEHRSMSVYEVLLHLIWHWTYHSGQVGLLRRLWGARYRWTFAG